MIYISLGFLTSEVSLWVCLSFTKSVSNSPTVSHSCTILYVQEILSNLNIGQEFYTLYSVCIYIPLHVWEVVIHGLLYRNFLFPIRAAIFDGPGAVLPPWILWCMYVLISGVVDLTRIRFRSDPDCFSRILWRNQTRMPKKTGSEKASKVYHVPVVDRFDEAGVPVDLDVILPRALDPDLPG